MIAVDEEYRFKGTGKKLIQKLDKPIIVYSNYSSMEFFKNIGFT